MNPICPKCGATVTDLEIFKLDAQETWQSPKVRLIAFACPHCKVILGLKPDA